MDKHAPTCAQGQPQADGGGARHVDLYDQKLAVNRHGRAICTRNSSVAVGEGGRGCPRLEGLLVAQRVTTRHVSRSSVGRSSSTPRTPRRDRRPGPVGKRRAGSSPVPSGMVVTLIGMTLMALMIASEACTVRKRLPGGSKARQWPIPPGHVPASARDHRASKSSTARGSTPVKPA